MTLGFVLLLIAAAVWAAYGYGFALGAAYERRYTEERLAQMREEMGLDPAEGEEE